MLPYTPWLVTLNYIRRDRGLKDILIEHQDDDVIRDYIAECSAEFQEGILPDGRIFVPYDATHKIDYDSSYSLPLEDDLLEVSAFTNGDGTALSSSGFLYTPANGYPRIQIDLDAYVATPFNYATTRRQALALTGTWGCVPHFAAGAFKPSGSVIPSGGLATGATELVLGADEGSRFEIGQYVQFGDASKERAQVTDIVEDTLTLAREELGTTAPTSHVEGIALQSYHPPRDVMSAVRMMVVYRYLHKDAVGSRVTVIANGVVQVEDLDPAVQNTIDRYRRQVMYFGGV